MTRGRVVIMAVLALAVGCGSSGPKGQGEVVTPATLSGNATDLLETPEQGVIAFYVAVNLGDCESAYARLSSRSRGERGHDTFCDDVVSRHAGRLAPPANVRLDPSEPLSDTTAFVLVNNLEGNFGVTKEGTRWLVDSYYELAPGDKPPLGTPSPGATG